MPTYGVNVNRKDDKVVSSPVTPAVTGIEYPNDDYSTEIDSSFHPHRPPPNRLYSHPNIAGSTIDDVEPPADSRSLDQIWGTIRQEKERKMAKERPKVQSLEEIVNERYPPSDGPHMQIPVTEAAPMSLPKSPRKQKSISNFRESTDGRAMVATFELPDVSKQDIHISFQRNKLVLTWETAEYTEWEEDDGTITREQLKKMFHRTLPLPEGTRFEEIHAQMTSKGLILRYPNMRCQRVEARSRSGDS